MKNNIEKIGGVILAAGKGKRMNISEKNKVTLLLRGKPIILHIVHFMHQLGLQTIIAVVGHEKESVMDILKHEHVLFAAQNEQLGTGHALQIALHVLPEHITDLLVVYGDDAVLYNEEQRHVVDELIAKHHQSHAAVSLLTVEQKNPFGLGRILRDISGNIISIVEEKDATEEQKKITEINPGCFLFTKEFLKKYLPLIEKSHATGEFYVTSLIDLAFAHTEKVETVRGGALLWRGVNTPEELQEAERLLNQ